MNANLQKYLKYKSKYLDLKNELEGGSKAGDIFKKFTNQLKDPRNLEPFKTKKKENKIETHNKKILPFHADKYKLLIKEKINLILIRKQELIIDIYKNYSSREFDKDGDGKRKLNMNDKRIMILRILQEKINQFKKMFEEEKQNIETIIKKYNKITNIINKDQDLVREQDQDLLLDQVRDIGRRQHIGGERTKISLETYDGELDFNIDNIIDETIERIYEFELNSRVKEENKNLEEFKLQRLKEQKLEIKENIKKIELRLEQLNQSKSERTTKVATKDSDDDPSKINRVDHHDLPSDDDDNGDGFDCEELKKNIDKLCTYYKNMKDINNEMKDKIKYVFKEVNELIKSTNKLHNKDKILTDGELTSISEDEKKTLNKDKLPYTISHIYNLIDNEKDKTNKLELIKKYSAISDDIRLYYDR
jgi:hypothetical protein